MWYNGIIKVILKTPLHSLISSGVMLLTYTGHKSGRRYSVPISYTRDEEDESLWTVSLRKRTWWRSLRQGTPVTLRLKGQDRLASVDVFESAAEVEDGLRQLIALAPVYARYLEIAVAEDGQPTAEALSEAAQKRIVVRFHLAG